MLVSGLIVTTPLIASSITWIAESPANDMNTPTNWSPNVVPGTGDNAIFDSAISNVDKNPTEQSADFSVSTIEFTNNASPFTIFIDNNQLRFSGLGITGAKTDATINVTNTNNSTVLGDQISFHNGTTATSASAILNITNTATQTGSVSGNYLNNLDNQFFTQPAFSMGNAGRFIFTNNGDDSTTGAGNNQSAILISHQAQISDSFTAGDHATIALSNSGSYSGNNTTFGNGVGLINSIQFNNEGAFQAGDNLNFVVRNSGINTGTGHGNNWIGSVRGAQAKFNDRLSLGDNGFISILNNASNSSQSFLTDFTGYIVDQQLYVNNQFEAGNNLSMNLNNTGVDVSVGTGGGITANIDSMSGFTGSQGVFNDACIVGNNANIIALNNGTCSGTKTMRRANVATMNQSQILFNGAFQAGNSLQLSAVNVGDDSSQGVGGNSIGTVSDLQIGFGSTCNLGDNSRIFIFNLGDFSGSNSASFGYAGAIGNKQFQASDDFQAGNSFNLNLTNLGFHSGSSVGLDQVAAAEGGQASFLSSCTLGNNSTISIFNLGINNSTSTTNRVGYSGGPQLKVTDDFSAGTNLRISIFNSASNSGNVNNDVGFVIGSQALFQEAFTVDSGAMINAFNGGTVTGSQIFFGQGFNILNGKATFQAVNTGIVGDAGISIQGNNLGGNANIILSNTSLNIDTGFSTFTIGELNGDHTSTAQSHPTLIINTEASTMGDFAGSIQDFPATASTLIKQGPGSQKLSGINTYTGLTTIQEGSLILTGSLAGNVNIDPLGILRGTGTVGGNVVNAGSLSPGESIGTLTILGNLSNSANYDVEVNGLGQTDLINVSGTAALNGGSVIVSSVDGTYQFHHPYTILSAANVTGTFSGATPVSPLLNPTLSYDANHVYLTLQTAIIRAAITSNQIAVAQRLDALIDPNANQILLLDQMLALSIPEAREALTSLSGYQHTNDLLITELQARQFIRRLYDPLRSLVTTESNDCCCECSTCEWAGFLEGGSGYSTFKGNKEAHGFKMNSSEFTAGIQKSFNETLTAGFAGSYEHDHYHEQKGGNSNSCLLGLYGLYRPACYYGLADIGYGHSSRSINRAILVGPLRYSAHSKPKISQVFFYGEAGADFNMGCLLIQPFAGIEVGNSWRKKLKEEEPHGWGLAIRKKNKCVTYSRIGLHLTTKALCNCIDLSLDVAWNRLLSDSKNRIKGQFIEFGDEFDIHGITLSKNSIDYALTLSNSPYECLKTYVEIIGESWTHSTTINVVAGIEFLW